MVNEESLSKNGVPLEIERKFLIHYLDTKMLEELGCQKAEIQQEYLPTVENRVRRIRKRDINGKTEYFYTEKIRLSDTVRIEKEKEISEEEYRSLKEQVVKDSYVIRKTRYYYYEGDWCFEIDFYPEWSNQVLVEIELPKENETVKLPSWMKVIREVTADKHYKNEYLAFHGFEF